MRPVKTHRFGGKRYRVSVEERIEGYHEDGRRGPRELYADPYLPPLAFLDTLVHECLHAEFPKMSEKRVDAAASNIARLLWRLGYRRKE